MPLEQNILTSKNKSLATWHLTEELHDLEKLITLSTEDNLVYKCFKLDKRKKEWLTSRLLLQHLLNTYPQISYLKSGKPYLVDSELHISISHATNYVSVALSHQPTALDIEIASLRVEKIANRFVHTNEWTYLSTSQRLKHLTLIWSAKETLYKHFDIQGILFKEQFEILPFEPKSNGEMKALCTINHQIQELTLQYITTENYVLVYFL